MRRRAILASIPAWLAPPGSRWGWLARRTRPPDRGAQPLAREDQHQPKRDLLNIVQDVVALWRFATQGLVPEHAAAKAA